MSNRERVQRWVEKLNESYQPTEQKPLLQIAEIALVLPALGLFYIWAYFNKYGIHYYLYFDLKDALAVMYEKLMPIIYICVIFSLLLTILIPDVLRKKNRTDTERERRGFSTLAVLFTVIVALAGFYVIMDVYEFKILTIMIFLIFAALSIYLYLFVHKNLGSGVATVLAFIFALNIANKDAKDNMTIKPRFNIILKNHSDLPVLTEGEKCRYFIYKTSNHYFIKDDCKKVIYAYSVSTGEVTSFSAK